MAATQQISTEPFEKPISKKGVASCRTTVSARPNASLILGPLVWNDEPLPTEVLEEQPEYKIIVPLLGIDLRNIYVVATPQSLLIEIRFKSSLRHQMSNAWVMENIERRISREFILPSEIERRATTIQVHGESLQITARKSAHDQQTPWSELIRFDTRASLGYV